MNQNIEYIRQHVEAAEILAQLAEEAAELAHAALKLRRTIVEGSPTPVRSSEAYNNIMEECADISVCLNALDLNKGLDRLKVEHVMKQKAERWVSRLQAEE